MKIIRTLALGVALAIGSASSAQAFWWAGLYRPDLNHVLVGGEEYDATVTDVIVTGDSDDLGARTYFDVDFPAPISGIRTLEWATRDNDNAPERYAIDPDYDLATKYALGERIEQGFLTKTEDVVIDGTHLRTGRIKNISPYVATVVLDDGETEQLYLDDVRRKSISLGDRVVITSCTKWFVYYDYQLRPADLRPVYEANIVYPDIPAPPPPPPAPAPPPPPPAPVPALW